MGAQISFSSFDIQDWVQAEYRSQLEKLSECEYPLQLGRVVQVDRSLPMVCTAAGSMRAEHSITLVKNTKTLAAVGDWVVLGTPPSHENAVIQSILPRKNSLWRPDRGRKQGVQTLASNIDVVFIVTPIDGMRDALDHLERQLVLAYQSGAAPVIVLSKLDLASDEKADEAAVRAIAHDVPVIVESAHTGQGVEHIAALIPAGKCGVLLGKSGVGKSTLINALVGDDVQRTGEVRKSDGKGRHTTIARRMVLLPQGGILIDAPGMRSFMLTGSTEGVDQAFPDIVQLACECRFRDCRHMKEPGCAVRRSIDDGTLSERRYNSYMAIQEEALRVSDAPRGKTS